MKPGSTVLPAKSSTLVLGPARRETLSLSPTDTNLPSLTANAWARGRLGSMVITLAFKMTKPG